MAHVVIIDDDPTFASALRAILAPEHEVTVFLEVPEEIEELLTRGPDLLFVDCMLPGESGTAFIKRLREHERGQRLSVVLMSSHHEMIEEANQTSSQYEEFLKKPCTMRQVLAVIRRRLPNSTRV